MSSVIYDKSETWQKAKGDFMEKTFKFTMLNGSAFNSRIGSEDVTNSERWLGFFLGPALVACSMCGQSYLNVFYTDVLNLSPVAGGLFLSVMPFLSRILAAITNMGMGRYINRTGSKHGKARPWILLSGILLAVSGILLFTVPRNSITIQVIWVTASYCLFCCVSNTVYTISNTLLVPLSTRNNKQRDTLAMASSMGVIVPGTIVTVVFPMFFLPYMGIDQEKWILVLSTISLLAFPAALIQYFFTRERVTEEGTTFTEETKTHSLHEEIRGCFKSKYWLIIISIITISMLGSNIGNTSLIYYANWVLGTYNDGVTFTLLNAVGQAPLGFGILFLWPLVKKFGKRNVMLSGLIFALIGSMVCLLNPTNLAMVLTGLFIRSFGTLSLTYLFLAMLADALDHVEWINGFRCDGFSSAIYSISFTVCSGIAVGVFNLLLGISGYVAPGIKGIAVQNEAVRNMFISCTFIVPAASVLILAVLLAFFGVEKELPRIQADIKARHK
jgi:GPH family glycoside/pentoside/hexuronide:cation symporter